MREMYISWRLAALALFLIPTFGHAGVNTAKPVSVGDSIYFRYPVTFAAVDPRESVVSLSPDGTSYVIFLQQGNIESGGIDVEIVTGSTKSLAAAQDQKVVARLFTTARRDVSSGTVPSTYPRANRLVWLADGKRIAFLWSDGERPTQVVVLNLVSGELKTLTRSPTAVRQFAISPDGSRIVYLPAHSADDSYLRERLARGFAVTSMDLPTILRGEEEVAAGSQFPSLYVADAPSFVPRLIWKSPIAAAPGWLGPHWQISPTGDTLAIQDFPVENIDRAWSIYSDPSLRSAIAYDAAGLSDKGTITKQVRLIDLTSGGSRPLWNAPNPVASSSSLIWSPDGSRVIIGPTFLPLSKEVSSADQDGWGIVEMDVPTGEFIRLPVQDALPVRWRTDGTVELRGKNGERLEYVKYDGVWRAVADSRRQDESRVRIEVRQDINQPPDIVAVDRSSGRSEIVLALNPRFGSSVRLGRVENITWEDNTGRQLQGRVYYPVNFEEGHRYPLIIQTNGEVADKEFSLSGNSHYVATAFAAQPLAGRGFLVVQVNNETSGLSMPAELAREPIAAMAAYESVVNYLVQKGLADPARLGIIGYSRSGWWVEYTLVNSHLRFGAAVVADNMEPSYGQYLLHGPMRSELERDIGAAPFAGGLLTWLERSPGFNLHRLCTPLRLENSQGGLIGLTGLWETFSMLKQLNRPVELYTLPDSDSGMHPLLIPAQILASQEGTVDWFDFWLNRRERLDNPKHEQYERWRKLRLPQPDTECWHARALNMQKH